MPSKQQVADLMFPHGRFRARALLAIVRHHWFIRLRWIIVGAAVALLLVDRLKWPEFDRSWAVAACVGILALVNVAWWLIGKQLLGEVCGAGGRSPQDLGRVVSYVNAQMTVDMLILTVVLRFSGGIENPMSVFYLFHMLIAALLLRPVNAAMQGCWAMLLYGGLAIGECAGLILPHYPFLGSTEGLELHSDWSFVITGICVLAAGVFGALFFTLQISSRLDEQERELTEANQALNQSQAAVEELQARRSRFMRTAAHQLKSPLTGIDMLAALIRDGVVEPDRVPGVIERISNRCQEAIIQVNELLTLARIEDATPEDHRSASTEVRAMVEKVAARFAEQIAAKNLQVEVSTRDCAGVRVCVEARGLEDCVGNLLENAIKYTPEGGNVWVKVTCVGKDVSISVRDTGMGIAEDAVDDIFDPFRRGNLALAANIPGSGLGLAIVREVVEQANGRIDVQSTVGKGSEFVLSFPRREASPDSTAVRDTRATPRGN
jgi:signal transduction histidine kinase